MPPTDQPRPTPEIRYRLTVDIRVEKITRTWYTPDQYEDRPDHNERLTVSEATDLGALDFAGAMGVLGALHDAVTGIKS